MVKITIRLVGEENDKIFKRIELNQEIHVDDLVKEIESVTCVPPNFQQITFRGDELPDLERPLQDIKFAEELVVSHSMLVNWRTYVQMIKEIEKMTTSGVTVGRREIALKARIQLSPLHSSKFFLVHPTLAIEELNISKRLNFIVHNTKKYLYRSALNYFKEAYPEKTVHLQDKSAEVPGVHLGVVVLIDHIPSFYAKTLGSIPGPDEESDFLTCPKIDLIEIFVYILFKLIGVGPVEVHVIPDITKSDLVFMATRIVDQFRTASGVSLSEILPSTSSEVPEPVYIDREMKDQLKILSSILCLSDLIRNKGNFGVAEKKENENCLRELKIIDFGINLSMIDVNPSILNSSFDITVLSTYIAKWNLRENIFKAKEAMNNVPALNNNPNVNLATFDRYFQRLEKALTFFKN